MSDKFKDTIKEKIAVLIACIKAALQKFKDKWDKIKCPGNWTKFFNPNKYYTQCTSNDCYTVMYELIYPIVKKIMSMKNNNTELLRVLIFYKGILTTLTAGMRKMKNRIDNKNYKFTNNLTHSLCKEDIGRIEDVMGSYFSNYEDRTNVYIMINTCDMMLNNATSYRFIDKKGTTLSSENIKYSTCFVDIIKSLNQHVQSEKD